MNSGLPWIITSEIYPLRLRGLLGAWSAMCQWAWQLCITKTTPYIFLAMGWGTWIFFAGCLILSAVWAFFFLPETSKWSLDRRSVLTFVQRVSPFPTWTASSASTLPFTVFTARRTAASHPKRRASRTTTSSTPPSGPNAADPIVLYLGLV